jgi:transposase
MRVAPEIILTSQEQVELTRLARSSLSSVRLAQRTRIVLLAAKAMLSKDIAVQLGVGRVQVSRWRERYAQSRLAGIERDLPRGAPAATHWCCAATRRARCRHRAARSRACQ